MRLRNFLTATLCAALLLGAVPLASLRASAAVRQQQNSPAQRLDVMRSRLETIRRTLNSAIAGLNAKDKGEESADDPHARLSGLEKETGKLLNEVNDLKSKQEKAERYDPTDLDKLETAVTELDNRAQIAMRETAQARSTTAAQADSKAVKKSKKGGGFLGLGKIFGGSDDEKYAELVGTVAPGRDAQLFGEATKEARKDNYETARALYSVIINTYPDSVYLPLSKLAIADTFYLEGTTSALIQAGQAYQDWVTFFPTHPLSDDVCMKMGEVEMRRMGLADRDIAPARKAEQRLKFCLQQYKASSLRPDVEVRLREVQNNLADHDVNVGNQYYEKYFRHAANNLKGAQSRYKEVTEKYPNYERMAEVLYRLGVTYVEEEEPDEATKYFQQLVRMHPNSGFAEKAKEKLAAIGAAVPDTAPNAVQEEPTGPGIMEGIFQQISGVVPKTVNKDGVIISRSSKGDDIIAAVIQNGGTLPANYDRPVNRTAPARDPRPVNQPAPKKASDGKKEASFSPTQPGAPANGTDAARPAATQPTTPATPPPANTTGVKP
ncbi:MAG TPA: outer membrane protein assembly factor BamD [Pyrinomonadaceae bacterium]|nr:outer membrane protein assembly factor BamD [Pyrinomonadaceae bacterium]